MNATELNAQTLEILNRVGRGPDLTKATNTTVGVTTGTGLLAINLQPSAQTIYPVPTPIRNKMPRRNVTMAGKQAQWRQIIGINTANTRAGVSEGRRGGVISISEQDRFALYKGFGLESFTTFEADYAGRGFDDVRALSVRTALESLMIQEEITILNGNTSLQLGQASTPVCTPVAGGSIAAATTNFVYCAPLTFQAYYALMFGPGALFTYGAAQSVALAGATLSPTIARANADGTTDTFGGGVGQLSAASSAFTSTSGNGSVTASVTAVKGAFGYAWFLGATAGAANALLAAVTPISSVTLTAAALSTYAANSTGLSTDNSTCALDFDGLISQSLLPPSGSGATGPLGYYNALGTTLTSNGVGGINEIDAALKYFWDNYRMSPSKMRVGSQVAGDVTKKVLSTSGSSPAYRIDMQSTSSSQGNIIAGTFVASYLNKYAPGGPRALPIEIHPYMPDATIHFDLDEVPYTNSNVAVAREILTRNDYYQINWPVVTRQWPFGVYTDEVLAVNVVFGTGVITNITPG